MAVHVSTSGEHLVSTKLYTEWSAVRKDLENAVKEYM
jgi:hypothetical protein